MKNFMPLLTAAVLLTASSCQKDPSVQPDQGTVDAVNPTSINVIDGRLAFADQATYDQTLKYLVKNQGELPNWEQQYKGYTSMRKAFESITSQQYEDMIENNRYKDYHDILTVVASGDEKEIVPNIEDRVASTLVNEKGLVQIGSAVYKIDHDQVVKFDQYAQGIDQKEYAASDPAQGIHVSTVKRHSRKSLSAPNARPNDEINQLAEYWYNTSKRRLIGTVYDWDPGQLQGVHIGVQTKHQRRLTGVWYAEEIPSIGLNASGSYQTYTNNIPVGGPIAYSTGQISQSNSNYLNYTLQYGGSNSYAFVYNSSVHSGTCKDGAVRNIYF